MLLARGSGEGFCAAAQNLIHAHLVAFPGGHVSVENVPIHPQRDGRLFRFFLGPALAAPVHIGRQDILRRLRSGQVLGSRFERIGITGYSTIDFFVFRPSGRNARCFGG